MVGDLTLMLTLRAVHAPVQPCPTAGSDQRRAPSCADGCRPRHTV